MKGKQAVVLGLASVVVLGSIILSPYASGDQASEIPRIDVLIGWPTRTSGSWLDT
jgi:hypothetical protein